MRLALSLALLLGGALAGCSDVEPRVFVHGMAADDVSLEVEGEGRLSEEEVESRAAHPDVDAVQRLPAGACPGGCRFVELTLYVDNAGDTPMAPPVVRVDAPPRRPERAPVALRAKEISPGRAGRIRWLVELWPGEQELDLHLSSSVFFDVTVSPRPPAPPAPAPAPPSDR